MLKLIKIILSIFSGIILAAIVIPVVLAILLSSYRVQNFVVSKITAAATERIGTTVSVDRVEIRLFNRAVLQGVYVEDFSGDTLLYAKRIDVGVRGYNLLTGMIRLGDVQLDGAKFFLTQDSTLKTNLAEILAKLKSDTTKTERKNDFLLRAASLKITDTHFKMRKYKIPPKPYGINFADLDVNLVELDIQKIGIVNDSIDAFVKKIAFSEKSSFKCAGLSMDNVKVSSRGVIINQMLLSDYHNSQVRMKRLWLAYDSWSAFSLFTSKVRISAYLENSAVSFKTISYFVPSLKDRKSVVSITGDINGTVNDLSGEIEKLAVKDTRLGMKFRITGLPDIHKTNFSVEIAELRTTSADIDFILNDFSGKSPDGAMQYLNRLETISLNGSFSGMLDRFEADASVRTSQGNVSFNASVDGRGRGGNRISGRVALGSFALGRVLDVKGLGSVSMTASLNGIAGQDSISFNTSAVINSLAYNEYTYTGININGLVRNKYYSGTVWSQDPALDFNLKGTFDFNRPVPEYDFALDLRSADLHKLGINTRDSVSLLSCTVEAAAYGTRIDDIAGKLAIKDITYRFNEDSVKTREIDLIVDNTTSNKLISFTSDFADIEMRSRLNFSDFIAFFKHTLRGYLPLLAIDSDPKKRAELESKLNSQANNPDNFYILKANIKENSAFATAVVPGLYIAAGTNLSFIFNPAKNDFSMTLNSDLIEYKNLYMVGLNLTNRNQSDSISVFMRTSEFGYGTMYMPDFALIGGAKNNKINIGFGFDNEKNRTSALINTTTQLNTDPATGLMQYNLSISSSHIMVGEQLWRLSSPRITVGKGYLDIERFRVAGSRQELLVSGKASASDRDTLHVALNNFDLAPLSGLVDNYGFRISGRTNGTADIVAATGNRLFYSKIRLEGLTINDKPLRDSYFETNWDTSAERISVEMTTSDGAKILSGGYKPSSKAYDIKADIPNIELVFLQPFLTDIMSRLEGYADAHITLKGAGDKPVINGSVALREAGATLSFTKAHYKFRDAVIEIKDNKASIKKAALVDVRNNEAGLEATVDASNFSDISYSLTLTPRNLLALNTTFRDNELFYGTAYASGTVNLRGDKRRVSLDIVATTENDSRIFMPLSGSASISEADFIVFETPELPYSDSVHLTPRQIIERTNRIKNKNKQPRKTEMEINMLLNIAPNTTVVQMNPIPSHTIRANGSGSLTLRIRPNDNVFRINGEYKLDEGKYDFTLPGLPVSKIFDIQRGSLIRFTGDPMDAILDITAIYELRASLTPLLLTETGNRQPVMVHCLLMLTERLSQPSITFDVQLPMADPETQSLVRNAMNTQEAVSTQFISLLLMNNFYAVNNTNSVGTALGVSTGIEFLSNQIGNLLSSENLKLGVGYRVGGTQASDELEASLSYSFIPNRLSIDVAANYNVGGQQNMTDRTENPLTGDVFITWTIDQKGNLKSRLFSRTINSFNENQGLQEYGVGLYYRHDIKRSFREMFRRREKTEEPEPEVPLPPSPDIPDVQELENR